MYWNILVWLRIEIPDGFLHQISENLKIDDLVTGGTINLQLTLWSSRDPKIVLITTTILSSFPNIINNLNLIFNKHMNYFFKMLSSYFLGKWCKIGHFKSILYSHIAAEREVLLRMDHLSSDLILITF